MATARWFFEPSHTGAEFRARHMMVTYVRGQFKNVHGFLEVDPEEPEKAVVEATIDATQVYTGAPERDAHLRSADFFDVEHHPTWRFVGSRVHQVSASGFEVTGDLTIRGVTRPVVLEVSYLGQWDTPWWEGEQNLGPRRRAGFTAKTRINRHDFGVSWNDGLDRGGVVVSDTVDVAIDIEAVLESPGTTASSSSPPA
ncbi:polyisoprenoid-binding protein YceI [Kitasatospora sp. GAS204A]|uniref:YceI family protein n=1 Tax=unclassified Kitasatospora TaxID=2633591 RepID=UPI0024738F8C|nr:YceI family protein [Kitasatospora sp. GAS204B]MDH6122189.1 polyisoprenoid-binding protein YceI [Kitasatospora sp. GAS204B]